MFRYLLAGTAAMGLLCSMVQAEVGDVTLRTDHPSYPGEGAFQTPADCVRFATAGRQSPQDQAIGLYLWLLAHQYHAASPQEPSLPGRAPDTSRDNQQDLLVMDANRGRFSYGYGLCGTVHAWNEAYWQALGMPARRRAFPGHTNSEVFYDGAWHCFDTDMAGLLFRPDGVVAGYDDLIADPKLAEAGRPPLPHYPYAWPADFNAMRAGWQKVAAGGPWYATYNSGYAAHPGIVHLRSGETFTRYFDRDQFGGVEKRRFWHNQAGGPRRDWTFVNQGVPQHDGEQSNSRGMAHYANGEFVYRPDLSNSSYREGVAFQSPSVASRQQSPRLFSRDGVPAQVVFRHFSPYVICGDPLDDANPMTAAATDGLVIEGQAVGRVVLSVSADEGQTWTPHGESIGPGDFRLDLTEQVKGRYGWQVRFAWQRDDGLDDVCFRTTTQVSQSMYPRLKAGGCEVEYRAASRGVVAVLPNWALGDGETHAFETVAWRSDNVKYTPRGPQSSRAFTTTDNKPGSVVFRVLAPASLTEVVAAVRYSLRVPAPPEADYRLDVSTDEGRTWQPINRSVNPSDNEFSSGWLAGSVDVSPSGANTALVRFQMYAGGYATGVLDAQFYGVHQTPPPSATTVTYGWREAGELRTHEATIPAGSVEHRFQVPTGGDIADDFVRIEVAAPKS